MPYPFSAKLVAINAPKPDAPPVTSTVFPFKTDKSKVLDRSAMGPMMAIKRKSLITL